MRGQNTQEIPRKVDWQDHSQRQQAHHSHEQDDVALEGQISYGVNATLAADLLVPTERKRQLSQRGGPYQEENPKYIRLSK